MKEYDNYIFDLYGTLIDIHTDEDKMKLWEDMTAYLNDKFGAEYESACLKRRYGEICKEEEKSLSAKNGADFPEIRIEKVWARLICEKVKDPQKMQAKAYDLDELSDSEEVRKLCIFFRESSRDKLLVYDGVIKTLNKLKEMGKGIFLLSNAQRVFTEKELSDTGLLGYFDDIFISSDKGIKKPQKEFLEMLIRDNSLKIDKCVMIGNDIFSDVGVAFKNGVESVFLNTYDFSEKIIDKELSELGIKGSELMPVIVGDGNICEILMTGQAGGKGNVCL